MTTIIKTHPHIFRVARKMFGVLWVTILCSCQYNKKIEVSSFKTNLGWGYEIRLNDKRIIKQSVIPVIEGVKGFSSEREAQKTGEWVKKKLENNQSPTITKNDLLLLGIKR